VPPIIKLIGLIAILCGFLVAEFLTILYVIVKKMGGCVERKALLTVVTFDSIIFALGFIMFYL
jgi:hypothetical protein